MGGSRGDPLYSLYGSLKNLPPACDVTIADSDEGEDLTEAHYFFLCLVYAGDEVILLPKNESVTDLAPGPIHHHLQVGVGTPTWGS